MPAALPPASPPLSLAIPLQPMLGCMGVAPSLDEVRPSIDCGAFGGNLDYNRLRAGTTLYLPVLVPGAYLFVGDGHAVQGAGEITGNGVEVSCAVRLRVRLVDMSIGCPRGEDGEVLFCVGCAEPLDQAFRLATREMETWLEQRFGMDERRAGMWMGQLVDYEIGNLVSHGFSAACTMPKSWLEPGRVG
jgi:acetamidase/formamidase